MRGRFSASRGQISVCDDGDHPGCATRCQGKWQLDRRGGYCLPNGHVIDVCGVQLNSYDQVINHAAKSARIDSGGRTPGISAVDGPEGTPRKPAFETGLPGDPRHVVFHFEQLLHSRSPAKP